MKKILFITAFPPNNKSGGQVFSLNLLKDLLDKYIVDLVYFEYKDHAVNEYLPVNSVKSFAVNNFNCVTNWRMHPIFTRRFNRSILHYLEGIASNYDIVFFDYSQVGLYAMYLNHPYKVIRCHDVLFQKFSRRDKIFKQWIKLTERKILKSVHKIFVLTDKDAKIIKNVYDLNAHFTHEHIKNFNFYQFAEKEKIFVFFGLWSRPENKESLIWFVENVLPSINTELKVEFVIIGGGLSQKAKERYLSKYDNMKYLGFVDDPLDIIYKASAVIAPLFTGAGVKVKVIDAFTTGTPVIGTDIAFEGLPYIQNLMYLANKPQEYADIINNFLNIASEEKQENANNFRLLYDNNHLCEQL